MTGLSLTGCFNSFPKYSEKIHRKLIVTKFFWFFLPILLRRWPQRYGAKLTFCSLSCTISNWNDIEQSTFLLNRLEHACFLKNCTAYVVSLGFDCQNSLQSPIEHLLGNVVNNSWCKVDQPPFRKFLHLLHYCSRSFFVCLTQNMNCNCPTK